MILDHEMATYEAKRAALLEKHAGRYVLIHGDEIVGMWDAEAEAFEEGYRRFLFEPFLIHRIVAEEKPIFVPRDILSCRL